ncbi:glucose-1-phosphate adenylyltransferase [Pseudothermotoga elfii]
MRKVLALILAGGHGKRLGVLTEKIAKPAVPFGGKYRLIDFTLSNCVNSGIYHVGVLTQYRPHLLNNHINIGRPWDLDRKKGGVTILPPYLGGVAGWYRGTANAVYQNIEYVDSADPDFVLILSGDHVYAMDYNDIIDFHILKGAEGTIACIEVPPEETNRFGIMMTDLDSKIIDFEEKPQRTRSNLASLGIYVFNWKFLKEYLIRDEQNNESTHDFGHDIIPLMINEGCQIYAFKFNGYWRDVGTVRSYWESNLELTRPIPPLNLYDRHWRFFTQTEEMPPAYCAPTSKIVNSIISEGCEIYGFVENSVIFQGVYIGENAVVKNSVVMTSTKIGENCVITDAVIAERVIVENRVIIGEGDDAKNKLDSDVYTGQITVIGMYSVIPSGSVIGKNCVVGVGVEKSDFKTQKVESGDYILHKE